MFQRRLMRGLCLGLVGVGGIAALVACGSTGAPPGSGVVLFGASVTATPSLLASKDAYLAGERAAYQTASALTPWPTKDLSWPLTPIPTVTPELGMLSSCPPRANALEPRPVSCWRGIVGGHIMDVQSLVDSGTPAAGFLLVNVWADGAYTSTDIATYMPPRAVGALRITAIDGLRFTLSPVDPTQGDALVFDLGTRLWVSPTPSYSYLLPRTCQLPVAEQENL